MALPLSDFRQIQQNTGNGIHTAFVITGANVHDSQVAIPHLQIPAQRGTPLYSLSDSGYSEQGLRRQNWIFWKGRPH
jgi:hypothetical protein